MRFQCVLDDIRNQARQRPHAPAVETAASVTTYAQLVADAQALSASLRQTGVQRESLVALLHGRAAATVTAMLAVLEAGAAFVPLDPDAPDDRLAWMLRDCGASVALAGSDAAQRLAAIAPNVRVLHGNDDLHAPYSCEMDSPQQLAYAIYTSGTTGKPKAALLTHGGLANLAKAQRELLGIGPDARVLQFAAPTFDACVCEVFVTLAVGATLCIDELSELVTPNRLLRTLRDRAITDVTLPPSILALLPRDPLPDLRTIVIAGERCPAEVVRTWAQGRRLINAYGPTESTVCATMHLCDPQSPDPPPIGTAIANTKVLVLDDAQRPVPQGERGELYIGGAGVARGYLNRPELTAERFVELPHLGETGRWFRTGDFVRVNASGALDFLGRTDRQVKVRGVRIELGEVERVIESSAHVRQAVVWGEDNHLMAAVVSEGSRAPDEVRDAVKQVVRRELPLSLLPAAIAVVERMPLTPHGKIDVPALKGAVHVPTATGDEVPDDSALVQMVRLWKTVLPGRDVSADADYFDLAGDSVGVLDLLARIERRWLARLSVASFLVEPTPRGLMNRLRESIAPQQATDSALVKLRDGRNGVPVFCIPPAGGNVLCYRPLAQRLDVDRPVYGIQAAGMDGRESRGRSLEAMAADYLADVDLVEAERPVDLIGWSFGGIVAYEMARQLQDMGRTVRSLVIMDAAILYSFAVLRRLFPFDDVRLYNFRSTPLATLYPSFSKQARHNGILAPDADETLARRVMNVFIANVKATAEYRPQSYDGPVHLIMGATPYVKTRRAPADEWRALSAQVIEHVAPGDHMTMLNEAHVVELARVVSGIVNGVQPTAVS